MKGRNIARPQKVIFSRLPEYAQIPHSRPVRPSGEAPAMMIAKTMLQRTTGHASDYQCGLWSSVSESSPQRASFAWSIFNRQKSRASLTD